MQIEAETFEQNCLREARPGFSAVADDFPMAVDAEAEASTPSSSLPSSHKTHKRYRPRPGRKDSSSISVSIPVVAPPQLSQSQALSEIQRVVEVMSREDCDDFTQLSSLSLHDKKAMLEKLKTKVKVLEDSLELARMALGKMTLG